MSTLLSCGGLGAEELGIGIMKFLEKYGNSR